MHVYYEVHEFFTDQQRIPRSDLRRLHILFLVFIVSIFSTHLTRIKFPFIINKNSPFSFKEMFGGIFFHFYSNFYIIFCKHTVDILIRRHVLDLHCLPMSYKKDARLIWVNPFQTNDIFHKTTNKKSQIGSIVYIEGSQVIIPKILYFFLLRSILSKQTVHILMSSGSSLFAKVPV